MKSLNEKPGHFCGVAGISADQEINVPQKLFFPLFTLQHRGQESAGVTFVQPDGEMKTIKGQGMVTPVLSPHLDEAWASRAGIGHVRYSTRGGDRIQNVQPLQIECNKGHIALGHNGNISNAQELHRELTFQGAIFQSSSDTELILHMIARSRQPDFESALREILPRLSGAYSLVMLHNETLYVLRDPQGFRPLYVGEKEGMVLAASETSAMNILQIPEYRSVKPGEIIKIHRGKMESSFFSTGQPVKQCIFELIYFAKPSSEVFDHPVNTTRKAMGAALAKDDPKELGDIVVPVPDSGNGAALGYARYQGLPFEFGFSRSHYTGRSFIMPTADDRELAVRMKLLPVIDVIKGKRVILVDDSLVRGTTSGILVRMLKEAGAAEVHLRLSSPEIKWPCYFGIDIPTRGELISNHLTPEGIAEKINADSLRFLPISRLKECVTAPETFCYGCFTGKYPILLPESLTASLENEEILSALEEKT